MSNQLKSLQSRFKKLLEPNNNFDVIDSLETVASKSEKLLKLHENYKKLKKNPVKNKKEIKIILRKLISKYREVTESMEIYTNIQGIKTLKQSLLKNLEDLESIDEPMYLYNNIPSMNNLEKRFNRLTLFSNNIRRRRKITKKKK